MKKVAITQDLCRMVELMLKGGAQQKEVGERLGISKATVSRIKTADYDAEQYRKNTTERVEKVEMSEGGGSVTARQAEERVEGQMEMELPLPVTITAEDLQVKLMRFQAAQVEKILAKLEKINDNLCQILRKADG